MSADHPWSAWADQFLDVRAKNGDEWDCLCWVHDDHNPSMRVNVQKGLYFCQACGAKGSLLKLSQGTDPTTGLEYASARLRSALEPTYVEEARILPETWLSQFLGHEQGRVYWHSRNLGDTIQQQFQLGFDPRTNSATIPMRDHHGQLMGVMRRRLDPAAKPKYLYPRGFKASNNLFGSWDVPYGAILGITEGPVDALTLRAAGCWSVALYGARLSPQQHRLITLLAPAKVLLFTDSDEAGQKAAREITGILRAYPIAGVASYPNGLKDVNEMDLPQVESLWRRAAQLARWAGARY